MKLDNEYIDIYIINNFIYYKVIEANKKDKYYIEIRKTIIENKNKF